MPFEAKNNDNHFIIYVDELRLDASLATSFKEFFLDNIKKISNPVIIDLSNIRFMDSSGLGALVFCLKQLEGRFPIILTGANEAVCDLFELTSMHKLFAIKPSIEEVTKGY